MRICLQLSLEPTVKCVYGGPNRGDLTCKNVKQVGSDNSVWPGSKSKQRTPLLRCILSKLLTRYLKKVDFPTFCPPATTMQGTGGGKKRKIKKSHLQYFGFMKRKAEKKSNKKEKTSFYIEENDEQFSQYHYWAVLSLNKRINIWVGNKSNSQLNPIMMWPEFSVM